MPSFNHAKHIGYFSHNLLRGIPSPYDKLDTNRLTLVHFCVHALDLLGALPDEPGCITDNPHSKLLFDKHSIIDWIYGLQLPTGGFVGGNFLGPDIPPSTAHGHIAHTYAALCTLAALGDDLTRVHREGILELLQKLQNPDGSFQSVQFGSECDMRFMYCACAISWMLQDWSGVHQEKAVQYIQSCVAYDGGISLNPGQEGHGGSTFCGLASLVLMNQTDVIAAIQPALLHWCVHRQIGGMQGRPNKAEDTCYSYWIGGTLALLGHGDLLSRADLDRFVLSCQTQLGGFSKLRSGFPDILHAFYSLAWMSLSQGEELGLKKLNCTLGMCSDRVRAFCSEQELP